MNRPHLLNALRPALVCAGLAAAMAGPAAAQPNPAGAMHATRTAANFGELEERLQAAIAARSAERMAALLHEDFEMILAQDPTNPVARDEWLATAARSGAAARELQDLSAREFGDLALVSYVLRAQPARAGVAALFVVDTWQRAGDGWRLRLRHVGPADGSRRGIAGDAGIPPIRKKY